MKTSTTLGFFKDLITGDGLKKLKTDFHLAYSENKRLDPRKAVNGYDPEMETYYLFSENYETKELSSESYPVKFRDKLRNRLEKEYESAIKRLDSQLEKRTQVSSIKKYLRSLYSDATGLLTFINNSSSFEAYPNIEATLKKLHFQIQEKLKAYDFKIPSTDSPFIYKRKNYRTPPDQDKVVEAVKVLMVKPRFTDNEGHPKPTTISNELMNSAQRYELDIQISERRMFDRVKDAIEEIEYHDVGSTS